MMRCECGELIHDAWSPGPDHAHDCPLYVPAWAYTPSRPRVVPPAFPPPLTARERCASWAGPVLLLAAAVGGAAAARRLAQADTELHRREHV
jgi:hypothetical protein